MVINNKNIAYAETLYFQTFHYKKFNRTYTERIQKFYVEGTGKKGRFY